MTIGVKFFNRDFSDYTARHWDSIQVKKYSRHAIGGPRRASFDVYGSEEDIWKFIEMLRCPVTLIDKVRGKSVWWGMISKVDVYSVTGIHYGVDIESMSNKIAIAYTYNYERETTGWGTDAESVAEYGTKELLLSASDQTAEQAIQYRANKLDAMKYPIRLPIVFGKGQDKAIARVSCVGWIATIAWKYYQNDSGKIAFEKIDASDPGYQLGNGLKDYCAQSFKSNSEQDWSIVSAEMRVNKIYGPYDYLQFKIWDDDNGKPGVVRRECEVVWAWQMEDNTWQWWKRDLDTPLTISKDEVYWLTAERRDWDPNDTEANYYWISAEYGGGYPDGKFLINKEAGAPSWGWQVWGVEGDEDEEDAEYPDMSAHFRLTGESETTAQIAVIVDEAQFFEGSDIAQTTGVTSYPFRDGESLALYELEELLKIGTGSYSRLIANVTENRIFQVYEEPKVGSDDYFIDHRGIVTDQYNNEIHLASCPVAYWVQLKDIIPVSVDVSRLSGGSRLFVEQSEYNAVTGQYRIMQSRDSNVITDALEEFKNPVVGFNRRIRYNQG